MLEKLRSHFCWVARIAALSLLCSSGYGKDYRWVAVGSLHNWFSDAGCEIEVGRRHLVSDQQDGLRWPAQYKYQDIQVAKGLWIGTMNYSDPLADNTVFPYKVVHAGPRTLDEENEFMPVSFKMIGKFRHPQVLVEGSEASSESLMDQVDIVDNNLPVDRLLTNIVNTSIGVTMTRRIFAQSQPDNDNYMIYEYVFKNTGIYDKYGNVQTKTLTDVVFFFQYRYAISRDVGVYGYSYLPQSTSWGHNTVNDVWHPTYGDNIRALYAYHGRHSKVEIDNIGGPNIGSAILTADGRLGAAQFPGVVVLHADKSAIDKTDDLTQPFSAPFFSSDAQIVQNNDQFYASRMETEYKLMTSGLPLKTHADLVGDGYADLWTPSPDMSNSGGFSQGMGFGPYTLAPGDSIRIVLAEGVSGLCRAECQRIGGQWYQKQGPFVKPDGSTTTNRDEFKNAWVFTGRDSIRKTFDRAKSTWENGFSNDYVPPPAIFEVMSDSDHIKLQWSDNAENHPHFGGYRLYRAIGSDENPYQCIFECGKGTSLPQIVNVFKDSLVTEGQDYYYYLTTFDDGTLNTVQPGKPLESSLFWTRTNKPARLNPKPLIYADIYVSPAGSDSNNGLDPATAFKTITAALSKIGGSKLHRNTIHIAGGKYCPATNGETFPLELSKDIKLVGDANKPVILDAMSASSVMKIHSSASVEIENVVITNGNGQQGGGLIVETGATVRLSGVTIKNNQADKGGGIYLAEGAEIGFDPNHRCNLFNNQALVGADIYGELVALTEIIVDSATVAKPCDYLAYPAEKYHFDVQHSIWPQYIADLYVSPDGNDDNTGLSSDQPLKTLRRAIIQIAPEPTQPRQIFLSAGIYSQSTTSEKFPIRGKSNLTICGNGNLPTILNAEMCESVFYSDNDTNLVLKNLTMINGTAEAGGGICFVNSKPVLENIRLNTNKAKRGGAIACLQNSDPFLSNVQIRNNLADDYGGAIYFEGNSRATFDTLYRCNIYSNSAGKKGYEFWSEYIAKPIEVFLDTFSLLYPLEEYVFPLDLFQFNIRNGLIFQVESDLFVNPSTGQDNNPGISAEYPLRTINHALEIIFADRQRPHRIILAKGTYSPANQEVFPIKCKSYVSIIGDPSGETVLDAGQTATVIVCQKVKEVELVQLKIINGQAERGGGIFTDSASVILRNLVIQNNSARDGAGIFASNFSNVAIFNSEISNNQATYKAGGIYAVDSDLMAHRVLLTANKCKTDVIYLDSYRPNPPDYIFSNLTISGNVFTSSYGGIRTVRSFNRLVLLNSIVRSTASYKVYTNLENLILVHSNIEDSLQGVKGTGVIKFVQQITARDPQFVGGEPFDYHLRENSPCIDRGVSLFVYENDTLLNLSKESYSGNAPDLGALESPYSVQILGDRNLLPDEFQLYANYPNPFNNVTRIKYALPSESLVDISVFDLNGRLVRRLIHEVQKPGYWTVVWDGTNESGRPAGSGMYICMMKTANYRMSRKLTLLK